MEGAEEVGEGFVVEVLCGAIMAIVGRKLVVVWKSNGSGMEMDIWCVKIEVKKVVMENCQGEVGRFNKVLCVSKGSSMCNFMVSTCDIGDDYMAMRY